MSLSTLAPYLYSIGFKNPSGDSFRCRRASLMSAIMLAKIGLDALVPDA